MGKFILCLICFQTRHLSLKLHPWHHSLFVATLLSKIEEYMNNSNPELNKIIINTCSWKLDFMEAILAFVVSST